MTVNEYRDACRNRSRETGKELNEYFKEMQGVTCALNTDFGKQRYIVPVVYSFYDSNEKCIYVGSTESLPDRIDWHMRKKYWQFVNKIGVRVYESRQKMRIAELIHIFDERPDFNSDAKYDDGKKMLFFNADGDFIEYYDGTPEAVFDKEELVDFLYSKNSDWNLIV